MSKRRAISSSKVDNLIDIRPVYAAGQEALTQPSLTTRIMSDSRQAQLTSEQAEVLKNSIVECRGPFWERILQMHGSQGTHTTKLAGWSPQRLCLAAINMYCDQVDISHGKDLPLWAQFTSKAISLNPGGSGIREHEVIQAAYDAYGWSTIEDEAIISLLLEAKAPFWNSIYARFASQFPGSRRTQRDVENRAIVLHRYHSYFHPLNIPDGLRYLRSMELSSFGLPWNLDWSEDEDATLLEGINKTRGPYWGKILGMYGASGVNGTQLASKTEIDLANRAREWWVAASGQQKQNIDSTVLETLQYIQPKGYTTNGMPTSRGWSEEQDEILISELNLLKAPNYNEILLRHGVNGRISEKLAPKNYAQLRGRALKLHDFCIREKRPMPEGLQYARRKD